MYRQRKNANQDAELKPGATKNLEASSVVRASQRYETKT